MGYGKQHSFCSNPFEAGEWDFPQSFPIQDPTIKELFEILDSAAPKDKLSALAAFALRRAKVDCPKCKLAPEAYRTLYCCYKDALAKIQSIAVPGSSPVQILPGSALVTRINQTSKTGEPLLELIAGLENATALWQYFLQQVLYTLIDLLNILCCCLDKRELKEGEIDDKAKQIEEFVATACCLLDALSNWAFGVIIQFSDDTVLIDGVDVFKGTLASNAALRAAFKAFVTGFGQLRTIAKCPCKRRCRPCGGRDEYDQNDDEGSEFNA